MTYKKLNSYEVEILNLIKDKNLKNFTSFEIDFYFNYDYSYTKKTLKSLYLKGLIYRFKKSKHYIYNLK